MFLKNQIYPLIQELNKEVNNKISKGSQQDTLLISNLCNQIQHLEQYIKSFEIENFIGGEILVYDFFLQKKMVSLYSFYRTLTKEKKKFHRNTPVFGEVKSVDNLTKIVKNLSTIDELFANKLKESNSDKRTIIINFNPSLIEESKREEAGWLLKYQIKDIQSLNHALKTTFTNKYIEIIQDGLKIRVKDFPSFIFLQFYQIKKLQLTFGEYSKDQVY